VEDLRFTSVGDAAAYLAGDEKIKQQVDEEICCSQLVNTLLQLRIEKGISQKELAKRIGCDPSKISRLEAGNDLQLKMGDVRLYLSALDVTMNLVFEDTSLPVAEQIKQHVFLIHEKLEQLVKLEMQVDGDEIIINKIHVFCSEVLFNFLSRFGDSYKRLCVVSCDGYAALHGPVRQTSDSELETEGNKSPEHSCCKEPLLDIIRRK